MLLHEFLFSIASWNKAKSVLSKSKKNICTIYTDETITIGSKTQMEVFGKIVNTLPSGQLILKSPDDDNIEHMLLKKLFL